MKKLQNYLFGSMCALFLLDAYADGPQSVSTDAILNLTSADTWTLFTTAPGLSSLGYAKADVDLRLGGKLRATEGGKLPAIDAEVSSFEPERMLSLKRNDSTWAVLYFQALGKDMTGLRWVEFAPVERAQNLSALAESHRELFNQLVRRYAPECELCKKEKAADK